MFIAKLCVSVEIFCVLVALYAWIKNARSMFVAKFCVSVEIFCVLVAKYCVFGAKYCVCVQVYNSLLAFFWQRVFFLNLCLFVHL